MTSRISSIPWGSHFRRALRFFFSILLILPMTARGYLQSLTDGEIFIQHRDQGSRDGSEGGSAGGGYAISFQRMVHSNNGKPSWYLKGVSVKNHQGQEIAKSAFAQWDDQIGIIYLEDSDRRIDLLRTSEKGKSIGAGRFK